MKGFLFPFIFITSFTSAFAQKDERFVLHLAKYFAQEKISIPFGSIRVIDARYEQKTIGCIVKDLSFKGMTEHKMLAVFPESFNTYLPKVLSNITTLEKGNTDTLMIMVKQFRVTDYLANTLNKKHEPKSVLTLSCSFYRATGGQVVKISSFDDVLAENLTLNEKPAEKEIDSLRIATVMNLLSDVFKNKKWAPSQTFFPIADVEKAIEKRFQLPVLHDTSLIAGIYKSFYEFQHNAPSVFDIKIGWQNDEIGEVRDASFNLISMRTFWGLCDGKHRYVSFLGRLYKLKPVDNSFRIVFDRVESDKILPPINQTYVGGPGFETRDILIAPGVVNVFKKSVRKEYLYLNMETGKMHVEELIGNADRRNL
jgi:hypothetical protein